MTAAAQLLMTAADYFQLPETMLPTELINGEFLEMPAPSLTHQDIVLNVAIVLRQLAKTIGGRVWIAPVDVHLDETNVPQPDVVWLADTNPHCVVVETKYLRGAPDLIVEVLSPGTALLDKREKFQLYEKYGVREYWLLHPTEQYAEIWQLQGAIFVRAGVFGLEDTFATSILGQPISMTAIFGELDAAPIE